MALFGQSWWEIGIATVPDRSPTGSCTPATSPLSFVFRAEPRVCLSCCVQSLPVPETLPRRLHLCRPGRPPGTLADLAAWNQTPSQGLCCLYVSAAFMVTSHRTGLLPLPGLSPSQDGQLPTGRACRALHGPKHPAAVSQ